MNIDQLTTMNACSSAAQWARTQPNPYAAWRTCPRGDWLLWWLTRAGLDRKTLVLAACDCARLVLHLDTDEQERPRKAIEAAEAWTRGAATIEDVRAAAYAAAAYADAAYADADAAAAAYADAAAYAAYAADAAAAAAAAAYADAAYARVSMRHECAMAVRKRVGYKTAKELWAKGA